MTDTIFALSSGAPPAAIAVIRISGPAAHKVLEAVAGPLPTPRTMALRAIRDPGTGETLDKGLVVQFLADSSVTGEDLAELHLHGSRAVVDAVEAALIRIQGLRPASAGEFTWRAFENGKLDLVQVESLSALLRSETEAQRRAAAAGEGLSAQVDGWRTQILLLSALVEARLDQSDEDDVPADAGSTTELARTLETEIAQLLDRPGAERLFDGVRVVFAGPPNAGKSTLINMIVQRDIAITSSMPGTTRDIIEAPVQLGGVAFVLTDTAGLRDGDTDEVEREGIARATRRIDDADIVVWMGGGPPPVIGDDKTILVHPRADEPGRNRAPSDRLRVSALTGEGVADLIAQLISRARTLLPVEGEVALSRRQRKHLAVCCEQLGLLLSDTDELIGAERLRLCRRELDTLAGRAGTEDMLDALFATFCVGK